jgi:hypothetical protein
MTDQAGGGQSVGRVANCRQIAAVGLSALHEQLVDAALSWLEARESLVFERVAPAAAAIVVLDGRSLVAQGVLSEQVRDPKKSFIVVGGSQTFSHPHIHPLDLPLSKQAMAVTLMGLCRDLGDQDGTCILRSAGSSTRRR